MIGEIGALDGGLVPNARGLSTQYLGTYYLWGFVLFAVLAVVMLAVRRANCQNRFVYPDTQQFLSSN